MNKILANPNIVSSNSKRESVHVEVPFSKSITFPFPSKCDESESDKEPAFNVSAIESSPVEELRDIDHGGPFSSNSGDTTEKNSCIDNLVPVSMNHESGSPSMVVANVAIPAAVPITSNEGLRIPAEELTQEPDRLTINSDLIPVNNQTGVSEDFPTTIACIVSDCNTTSSCHDLHSQSTSIPALSNLQVTDEYPPGNSSIQCLENECSAFKEEIDNSIRATCAPDSFCASHSSDVTVHPSQSHDSSASECTSRVLSPIPREKSKKAPPSPTSVHVCNLCGKRYRHNASLKNHMRKHESGALASKRFRCNFCVYSSQYRRNVHKHIDSTHRDQSGLHAITEFQSMSPPEPKFRGRLNETRFPDGWVVSNGSRKLLFDVLNGEQRLSGVSDDTRCQEVRVDCVSLENNMGDAHQLTPVNSSISPLGAGHIYTSVYSSVPSLIPDKRRKTIGSPISYSSPNKTYQCEIQGCAKVFKTNKSRISHVTNCHRSDISDTKTQHAGFYGFLNERRNSLHELLSPEGSDASSQRRISFISNRPSPSDSLPEFYGPVEHNSALHVTKRSTNHQSMGSNALLSLQPDVYSFTDTATSEYRVDDFTSKLHSAESSDVVETCPNVHEAYTSGDSFSNQHFPRPSNSEGSTDFASGSSKFHHVTHRHDQTAFRHFPQANSSSFDSGRSTISNGYEDVRSSWKDHSSLMVSSTSESEVFSQTGVENSSTTASSNVHQFQITPRSQTLSSLEVIPSTVNADLSETYTPIGQNETPDTGSHGQLNSETDAFFTDLEEILAREVPLIEAENDSQCIGESSGDSSCVPLEGGCRSTESLPTKSPNANGNSKHTGSLMSGDSGLESWSSSSSCSAGPNSASLWGTHEMGAPSKPSSSATTPQSSYATPNSDYLCTYSRASLGQPCPEDSCSFGVHSTVNPGSLRLGVNQFSPAALDDQAYLGDMRISNQPFSESFDHQNSQSNRDCVNITCSKFSNRNQQPHEQSSIRRPPCDAIPDVDQTIFADASRSFFDCPSMVTGYPHAQRLLKQDDASDFRGQFNPNGVDNSEIAPALCSRPSYQGITDHNTVQPYNHYTPTATFESSGPPMCRQVNPYYIHRETSNFTSGDFDDRITVRQSLNSRLNIPYGMNEVVEPSPVAHGNRDLRQSYPEMIPPNEMQQHPCSNYLATNQPSYLANKNVWSANQQANSYNSIYQRHPQSFKTYYGTHVAEGGSQMFRSSMHHAEQFQQQTSYSRFPNKEVAMLPQVYTHNEQPSVIAGQPNQPQIYPGTYFPPNSYNRPSTKSFPLNGSFQRYQSMASAGYPVRMDYVRPVDDVRPLHNEVYRPGIINNLWAGSEAGAAEAPSQSHCHLDPEGGQQRVMNFTSLPSDVQAGVQQHMSFQKRPHPQMPTPFQTQYVTPNQPPSDHRLNESTDPAASHLEGLEDHSATYMYRSTTSTGLPSAQNTPWSTSTDNPISG